MSDLDTAVPAYTSACGNVTIEGGPAPTVRLAHTAVRLPVRQLADLVAGTARAAADTAALDTGSTAPALAELRRLRDGLHEEGLAATVERRRAAYDADVFDRNDTAHLDSAIFDSAASEPAAFDRTDPRATARPATDAAYPTAGLDAAIALLERFEHPHPAEPVEDATGTATSPDGQVTVEATGRYPIARVVLGPHAREEGPDYLAERITETAARAAADLDKHRSAHIDALGLPFTQDQVEGFPDQMRAYADKITGQAAYLQRHHQDAVRRLRQ
ncbi:YbaB/EbfC family nucleoid-associated protein [Glycomyces sp. NPDC048151]|uniref:YbaB/EbfC family nucleoid-associated protein n=1 Tax=Glycomyces sp. NPDC048151 TaxID=3364002 RepID=UPI0037104E20